MTIFQEKVLKATWTNENGSKSQSFAGAKGDATNEEMNAFFSAIEPLTLNTLSFKGYSEKYEIVEE